MQTEAGPSLAAGAAGAAAAPRRRRPLAAFAAAAWGSALPGRVTSRYLAQFHGLSAIDPAVRWRLSPYIRWHATELGRSEFGARIRAFATSLYTALPVALIIAWLSPTLADLALRSGISVDESLLAIRLTSTPIGIAFVCVVLVALLAAISAEPEKRTRRGAWPWIARAVRWLAGVFVAWWTIRCWTAGGAEPTELTWRLFTLSLLVLGVSLTIAIARANLRRGLHPLRCGAQTDIAPSLAVRELLAVMEILDDPHTDWGYPCAKREIVTRLDSLAQALDPCVGAYFRCSHPGLGTWISRRFSEISASIQELAHMTLCPGAVTHDELRTRTASLLVTFVEGSWSGLPRSVAVAAGTRKATSAAVQMTIRRTLVVLTPALLVYIYYTIQHALPRGTLPEVSANAMISAAVLSITGLVNVVNPHLGSDLSLAKSVTDLLHVRSSA